MDECQEWQDDGREAVHFWPFFFFMHSCRAWHGICVALWLLRLCLNPDKYRKRLAGVWE